MNDSNLLFLGLLFGSIGMGYLIYGIKQRRAGPLLCGAVICVLPYFAANIVLLILLGALLMALPIFFKL